MPPAALSRVSSELVHASVQAVHAEALAAAEANELLRRAPRENTRVEQAVAIVTMGLLVRVGEGSVVVARA